MNEFLKDSEKIMEKNEKPIEPLGVRGCVASCKFGCFSVSK